MPPGQSRDNIENITTSNGEFLHSSPETVRDLTEQAFQATNTLDGGTVVNAASIDAAPQPEPAAINHITPEELYNLRLREILVIGHKLGNVVRLGKINPALQANEQSNVVDMSNYRTPEAPVSDPTTDQTNFRKPA